MRTILEHSVETQGIEPLLIAVDGTITNKVLRADLWHLFCEHVTLQFVNRI